MHSIASFIGAKYISFKENLDLLSLHILLDNLTTLAGAEIISFILLINTLKLLCITKVIRPQASPRCGYLKMSPLDL